MGLQLKNKSAVALAIEGPYGVEVVPTEGFLMPDVPTGQNERTEQDDTFVSLGSQTAAPSEKEPKKNTLTFKTPVTRLEQADQGTSSIHDLLMITGWEVRDQSAPGVIGAGQFIEYRPRTGAFPSGTFWEWITGDGADEFSIRKFLGSRGNAPIRAAGGGYVEIEPTIESQYFWWEDVGNAATYPAPARINKGLTPLKAKDFASTFGGVAVGFVGFEVNRNMVPPDETEGVSDSSSGIAEILYEPGDNVLMTYRVMMDMDFIKTGGNNFYRQMEESKWTADFPVVITQTVGNWLMTITVGKFVPRTPTEGEFRGRTTLDLEGVCLATGSNDEVFIRMEHT